MNWWIFALIAVTIVTIFVIAFRSLRRWPQSPPRDPETRAADAELWSTKNTGGGAH